MSTTDPLLAATDQSRELKRCSITDHQTNKDYSHSYFEDVGAKAVSFDGCDFSYSVLTRAYFYHARFVSCKFVGTRFIDCNFRNAQLIGCDFEYSTFRGTIISSKDVLTNLPEWPKVRKELMQAHRVNAASIGDDQAAKIYIREQLLADREDLRRARERKESYYSQRYSGFLNWTSVRWRSFWLWVDWITWGHGEYPFRIALSIGLLLLVLTILVALGGGAYLPDQTIGEVAAKFIRSAKLTVSLFLGTPYASQPSTETPQNVGWTLMTVISIVRYIVLSLFVSVLFRRLSRR